MRRKSAAILMATDFVLMCISFAFALLIRFDGNIPPDQLEKILSIAPYLLLGVVFKVLVLYSFKLYKTLWRYASVNEVVHLLVATLVSNGFLFAVLLYMEVGLPRSIYPIVFIFDLFFISGVRFAVRLIRGERTFKGGGHKQRVLILGAGEAGTMVLKELMRNKKLDFEPICFVDDDPAKKGQFINGISVLGGREDMDSLVKRYAIDEIIFAMPSISPEEKKRYIDAATKTGAVVKTIPGVYEIIDGVVELTQIRGVKIEDLLGRDEVELDESKIEDFITGKRVLITGGGGSIGSELARQIARYKPSKLVLVDIYENNLYDLQNDLVKDFPELNLFCLIESVRNEGRIEAVMKKHRPQIVFHAAAHKHVPLMEASPHSAILNNVFGTYNMAHISSDVGVEKFVFISTDKAVNPTNVMGTTKRLGEMIIQAWNASSKTEYVAVRFGNVLGSNGSVIPLFKKQIEEGGPITVTDPEITRYFMTIPEAAKLVLQAGSFAKGGEIFILDMGDPIKILDLAKNMIRLSGFEPGRDIRIVFSGLRPGEKLYEELLLDKSRATVTAHEKIFIEPKEYINMEQLDSQLRSLWKLARGEGEGSLINELKTIVPTYTPDKNHDTV